jgi:glycosyltransferase involved in cell wall biosynthesis
VSRVLLVHQPIDGGVARHVADLFCGLTARGYEVVLCGPSLPSASPLSEDVPRDAPHVPLEMGRSVAPAADIVAMRRFRRIARSVRPDVIHAHSSKAGAVARLGRLLGTWPPVLYTPHGYAFAGYFEHELERRLYREAERALAPLAGGVIAVCEAEARLALAVGPSGHVRVVHNGIDPPPSGSVDARVKELAREGLVIATLTQLRPGKGVETLIDALPPVIARHPNARMVITGDGPLRTVLAERARERGVAGAITFLGEHADPIAVLRGADVFLLTSWAEAFPYVILESMAVALAIISSDVGGVPEAIDDRQSGLLVAARDAGATAAALIELLDDPGLRARLGHTAREAVRRRFSRAAMVDGVAAVYREVLDAQRLPSRRRGS